MKLWLKPLSGKRYYKAKLVRIEENKMEDVRRWGSINLENNINLWIWKFSYVKLGVKQEQGDVQRELTIIKIVYYSLHLK